MLRKGGLRAACRTEGLHGEGTDGDRSCGQGTVPQATPARVPCARLRPASHNWGIADETPVRSDWASTRLGGRSALVTYPYPAAITPPTPVASHPPTRRCTHPIPPPPIQLPVAFRPPTRPLGRTLLPSPPPPTLPHKLHLRPAHTPTHPLAARSTPQHTHGWWSSATAPRGLAPCLALPLLPSPCIPRITRPCLA